jgi:nucleotide-binding universal stress UspA family protein
MDLTTASSGTLDLALSLAEENMARVTLLHVLEGAPGQFGPPRYRALPQVIRVRKELFEEAHLRLHRSVPAEARTYCSVSERVEEGAAWREILRVADAREADVIVMGAHSGGGLNRAVFRSTVNHVVREAHCPVLVVREGSMRRTVEQVAAAAVASAAPAAAGR